MSLALNSTVPPFGWWIALYFACAALAAGVVIRGAWAECRSGDLAAVRRSYLWALVALGVGGVCLIADLASPADFWMTLTNFNTGSWIAWGSRILGVLGILVGVRFVFLLGVEGPRRSLSMPVVFGLAAFALSLYPALVLMQATGRPLWDSPLLPPLFVASALHLGWSLGPQLLGVVASKQATVGLVALELVIFAIFAGSQRELLFHGAMAWVWAILYLGLGLLLPVLALGRRFEAVAGWLAFAGILALRNWLIEAGQSANSFIN